MPRILAVDDEPVIRQFTHDALVDDGFEVLTASTTSEALALVKKEAFDLFVCDVNVPDINGFGFRDEVRKMKKFTSTPFLFVSGADPQIELEIARRLGSDKLLIKPVALGDLRRAVRAAMGMTRAETGALPGGLDQILTRVVKERETGILTAVAGTTVKRVVFSDGTVAFAGSNDPREVIGQAFVRSGLITEKELAEAFAVRESAVAGPTKGAPLGKVLTALRKVTPEQAEKVFRRKIREAVLDLFLWKGGVVEYVAGGVESSDRGFPIALDLASLRIEGLKRRARWQEVRRLLPDPGVKFEVVRWPEGFPRNEGDKVLANHVKAGRSMAEIMVELRGQDFAVGSRLGDLVKAGSLRPVASAGFVAPPNFDSVTVDLDEELARMEEEEAVASAPVEDGSIELETVPGLAPRSTRVLPAAAELSNPLMEPLTPDPMELSPDMVIEPEVSGTFHPPSRPPESVMHLQSPGPESPIVGALTRALVLFRAGDFEGARHSLLEVLERDPMNALARQRLHEVDGALAAQAVAAGLRPEQRVMLAVAVEGLVGQPFPPNDAFILTRLASGPVSLGDLVRICPLPQNEVLGAVQRYLTSGVLRFA